jgi:hypothetical protein
MHKLLIPAMAAFPAKHNNNPSEEKSAKPVAPKQYSIQQLYKTKNIGGAAFNKDDSKIMVQNNETGIYNIYEISLSDTSMKALTTSAKESNFADDYVPGTDMVIYDADQGGNENSHLYLRHPDGCERPHPGATEKANFTGWNKGKPLFIIPATNAILNSSTSTSWILRSGLER